VTNTTFFSVFLLISAVPVDLGVILIYIQTMKVYKKILLIWGTALAVIGLSFLLPHAEVPGATILAYSVQLLLFIVSCYIAKREPTTKNKFIFINFAVFFSVSIIFHTYNFVGSVFWTNEPFARLYFAQYIAYGIYFFLMAFGIVYLTIDALFRDYKTLQKYALAFLIVGGFYGYYYHPYFVDAKYLYSTDEVLAWKQLSNAAAEFKERNGVDPTLQDLVATTEMHAWKGGQPIGVLFPDESAKRIEELYPYLLGTNFSTLVLSPLYKNVIYMNVLCLAFTLLFFGYQYKKDPPQGAYIEKIMFMFLLFSTLEILHAWSFIKSLEWSVLYDIINVSHYVSAGVFVVMTLFFALRLRFINSVKGEFYEQELATSPSTVTRWRDFLDNLLINHFFNRKALLGRLFVDANDKRA
jgi:hypothetical protein